ncbi:MAG: hypothetical protein QOE18_1511, partial [Chloroflexota bacterium]|nr:hypothetical protein [Chloroflexota bacterium]
RLGDQAGGDLVDLEAAPTRTTISPSAPGTLIA